MVIIVTTVCGDNIWLVTKGINYETIIDYHL